VQNGRYRDGRRYGNGWGNDYRGWNDNLRGYRRRQVQLRGAPGRVVVNVDYSGIRRL
jgi:hypothetical protein